MRYSVKRPRVILVELGVLGLVLGAIVYSLILPNATFHFQKLTLNFYKDGSVDFSTDATSLIRSLGAVSILSIVLGLVIGTTITLVSGATIMSPPMVGTGPAWEAKRGEYQLLSKLGALRELTTDQGVRYEVTETGLDFMRDYLEMEKGPQESRSIAKLPRAT